MWSLLKDVLGLKVTYHVIFSLCIGTALAVDWGAPEAHTPVALSSAAGLLAILYYSVHVFLGTAFAYLCTNPDWLGLIGSFILGIGLIGAASSNNLLGPELRSATDAVHPLWFYGALVCAVFLLQEYRGWLHFQPTAARRFEPSTRSGA